MKKQILFLQGAGEGAYDADQLLATSLQQKLGGEFEVVYPPMPDEDNAPYQLWKDTILGELAASNTEIILVGHSVGASVIAKLLSEVSLTAVAGIFLIANPFWGGDGWTYDGYQQLELPEDFAKRIPKNVPVFLYHCRDDEIVPFSHLSLYAKLLPQAKVRELPQGGHQLNDDLTVVAEDIRNLE